MRFNCQVTDLVNALSTVSRALAVRSTLQVLEGVLAESCPVPVRRVGMNDTYGHSGTVPALLEAYGLTAAHIAQEARAAVAMKK